VRRYKVKTLLEEAREAGVSTARGNDHQIHHDHHQVVAPAVGAEFAPEACVPDKYFLLDRAQQQQNQADGGELRQNPRDYTQCTRTLRRAQKDCEALAHSDAFASRGRVFQMIVAAGDEHDANHQAQEEQREIAELSQLRKRHPWHSAPVS